MIFGEKITGIDYKQRIGAYGIGFNAEGKVAVVRTATGYFLPGGGIENNETHEACIKRECIEEIGYKIKVIDFIGTASKFHYSDTLHYYMHGIGYFYYMKLEKKITDRVEEDHQLVWLSPAEAIENLFLEHQRWAVEETIKNFHKTN
ncbi:MAG: NUDIX hydrolase [Bacillaceae bacterium]